MANREIADKEKASSISRRIAALMVLVLAALLVSLFLIWTGFARDVAALFVPAEDMWYCARLLIRIAIVLAWCACVIAGMLLLVFPAFVCRYARRFSVVVARFINDLGLRGTKPKQRVKREAALWTVRLLGIFIAVLPLAALLLVRVVGWYCS